MLSSPFLEPPPTTLSAWVAEIERRPIPVLAATATYLADMSAMEDAVDAHLLAPTLSQDPLFSLRVLKFVTSLRKGREGGQVETVGEALVMLGIPPFFRHFHPAGPIAEEILAGRSEAATDFGRVLHRAQNASTLSLAFAIHRQDQDAIALQQAASLHEFAELVLWLLSPDSMSTITLDLAAHPSRRTADAQIATLGITTQSLQHELMTRWQLPELLQRTSGDQPNDSAQARNVTLAVRLARHSASGWDNPALQDDMEDLSRLLQLTVPHAENLVHDVLAEA